MSIILENLEKEFELVPSEAQEMSKQGEPYQLPQDLQAMSATEQRKMFERETLVILNELLKTTDHKVQERKYGDTIFANRLNPDRIIKFGRKTQALCTTAPTTSTTNEQQNAEVQPVTFSTVEDFLYMVQHIAGQQIQTYQSPKFNEQINFKHQLLRSDDWEKKMEDVDREKRICDYGILEVKSYVDRDKFIQELVDKYATPSNTYEKSKNCLVHELYIDEEEFARRGQDEEDIASRGQDEEDISRRTHDGEEFARRGQDEEKFARRGQDDEFYVGVICVRTQFYKSVIERSRQRNESQTKKRLDKKNESVNQSSIEEDSANQIQGSQAASQNKSPDKKRSKSSNQKSKSNANSAPAQQHNPCTNNQEQQPIVDTNNQLIDPQQPEPGEQLKILKCKKLPDCKYQLKEEGLPTINFLVAWYDIMLAQPNTSKISVGLQDLKEQIIRMSEILAQNAPQAYLNYIQNEKPPIQIGFQLPPESSTALLLKSDPMDTQISQQKETNNDEKSNNVQELEDEEEEKNVDGLVISGNLEQAKAKTEKMQPYEIATLKGFIRGVLYQSEKTVVQKLEEFLSLIPNKQRKLNNQ